MRWAWVVVPSLAGQLWAVFWFGTDADGVFVKKSVIVISYLMLIFFAAANLRSWGMRILALGLCLNLAAIAANGGLMPISPEAVAATSRAQVLEKVRVGEALPGSKDVLLPREETRLLLLTDILVLPRVLGSRVVSAGDLLVGTGGFLLFAEGLRWLLLGRSAKNRAKRREVRSVRYKGRAPTTLPR